jgi:hypothetical protein
MLKTVIIALVSLLIFGCASQWNHPTASQYDFQIHQAECNMYARQASPTTQTPYNPYLTQMQQAEQGIAQGSRNLGASIGQLGAFNDCMYAKGYYKQN